MVVLISGVSLTGYVALRLVGERYGPLLLGVLGGLVSSTATTLVYARSGRAEPALAALATMVILISNLMVLIRLATLTAIIAPAVLPQLAPLLAGGLILGLGGALYHWRTVKAGDQTPVPEIGNPTELKTAFGFGVLYAAVLLLAAWLSHVAGAGGVYAVALASGLTDVDAITLSSLRLIELEKLGANEAVTAIGLAMLANIGFKTVLVFVVGGVPLGLRVIKGLLLSAVGIAAVLLLR